MINNYLKNIIASLLMLAGFQSVVAQTYSVSSIPFQSYSTGAAVAFTADDTNSAPITIPFNFTFFGNTYNKLVVSTNGYVDFRVDQALMESPWSFSNTIPNVGFPLKNSILGCYHDLDNSNAEGTVTFATVGQAPYRKFIVMYDNNSQFQCTNLKSSFQIILTETLNTIDSQIIQKPTCSQWNGGRAVIGIVNSDGSLAYAPPGRNTGSWTTTNEGWRFTPVAEFPVYYYAKCDNEGADGFETFNMTVVQNDLSAANPSALSFYETLVDAQSNANPIASLDYANTIAYTQSIYASGNGVITQVVLNVLNCDTDYDNDTIATSLEDLNSDGNLSNDDTDFDGIANYLDNDDDGDLILTEYEYVFGGRSESINDTDGDGILNYLDNDDDGDGVLTIDEDYNGNGNPADDDTNENEIPDYLESSVALGVGSHTYKSKINVYPNPISTVFSIDNKSGKAITNISLYTVNGALVKTVKGYNASQPVSISDLPTGIYFAKVMVNGEALNYKLIKN